MCIIVDANQMGTFLREPRRPEVEPIHKWLEKSGRLIYSDDGQFRRELGHTAKQKLQGYVQAGVAKGIPSSSFHAIEANYQSNENVKSDDAHILALAKHTGARLLFTEDKNLIEDFKNKDLINKPRGKVYKNQEHAHLLSNDACKSWFR